MCPQVFISTNTKFALLSKPLSMPKNDNTVVHPLSTSSLLSA